MGSKRVVNFDQEFKKALKRKEKQVSNLRNSIGSKIRSEQKRRNGKPIVVKYPALQLERELEAMSGNKDLYGFPVLVGGSIQNRCHYEDMLYEEAVKEAAEKELENNPNHISELEELLLTMPDLTIKTSRRRFSKKSNFTFEMAIDDIIQEIKNREELDDFLSVCEKDPKTKEWIIKIYGDFNHAFLAEAPYLDKLTLLDNKSREIIIDQHSSSRREYVPSELRKLARA